VKFIRTNYDAEVTIVLRLDAGFFDQKLFCLFDELGIGFICSRSHHLRGADELPHRGLKDFGAQQLPFKRFAANSAFYYCMLIGFFLFETFKEDILADILPELTKSYPTTIRRTLVDFAVKIVRSGGRIILKVTHATMEQLKFDQLWYRLQNIIPLAV